MRYYPYSVKDELMNYFGDNPVDAMRKPNDTRLGAEERKNLTPLAWQEDAQVIMTSPMARQKPEQWALPGGWPWKCGIMGLQ